MQRQENISKFQSQTDALACNINFHICLQDMDSNGRLTKKHQGHGCQMFPQDPTSHTRITLPMKKCAVELKQPSAPLKYLLTI